MASNNTNTAQEQPGLVAGHAEYVKGAAEAAIGGVTGSQPWKASGEQDKAHGMATMKAAGEKRDPATQGFGKPEAVAGKLTGCEGMEKEGVESMRKDV